MSSDLHWTSVQNGLLLSGFFWGYLVGNFPGGILASRYGGRPILLGSMSLQIGLTLLSPLAARSGIYYFFFVRFLLGVVQGPLYPACQTILSRWLRSDERSRGNSMFDSGSYLSTAVSLGFGTKIMNALGSWSMMYYGCGVVCLLFLLVAFLRVESFPGEVEELEGEQAEEEVVDHAAEMRAALVTTTVSINRQNNKVVVVSNLAKGLFPWRELLLRKSIVAAIAGPTSINWSIYMFLTYLPLYAEQQLGLNSTDMGPLFVTPYVLSWIIGVLNSFLADYFIRSQLMSITNVRKLMQMVACLVMSAALLLLGSTSRSHVPVLLCFAIVAGGGITASGSTAVPMDLSIKYAGFIKGVANSIGTLGGALNPILVGFLLSTGGCPSEDLMGKNKTEALVEAHTKGCKGAWTQAFTIAAVISVAGGVTFLLLGSSVPIVLKEEKEEEEEEEEEEEQRAPLRSC